ncbi:MAG TPA: hypothetical protein DCL48_15575 [Alphaproteobacteria bacterium]|nr:hypothetical protein [Alphaproteobacteria bacterium]
MARLLNVPFDVQEQAAGPRAETFANAGRRTVIDLTGLTLPAIAGGANLGVGRKIFTFPSGAIKVIGSSISVALKQTQGNVTADTPDLGLGTTIASGAVALLSGTAAFENVLTGQTVTNCNGSVTSTAVATELLILSGDSHDLYLNVADGWAASGEAAMIVSGTVTVTWLPL